MFYDDLDIWYVQRAMVYRSDAAIASISIKAQHSSQFSSSNATSSTLDPIVRASPVVRLLHETLLSSPTSSAVADTPASTSMKVNRGMRSQGPRWKIRQLKDMKSMVMCYLICSILRAKCIYSSYVISFIVIYSMEGRGKC